MPQQHHRSKATLLMGVLAISLPTTTLAFTASSVPRQTTRLVALQVDSVAEVVDESVVTTKPDDSLVVEALEEQHTTWEVDMEAIHSRLEQRIDFPVEDNTADDATKGPAEELLMEVQQVEAIDEPVAAAVKTLETQEDTVIIPVESTTLRAESETRATSMSMSNNEPLLELTAPGNTDMLAHLTAKLATAQRVIATVAKENQDMKKERGLLVSKISTSKRRRLINMFARNKKSQPSVDSTTMLSEITHDAIEIDSVLRLSMLVSTAQRTMQALLQENRDLQGVSYYGASGLSLVPAQGPEELVV